ncbi:hypothetical protein [Negadavirga shengliensis]|uniref:Uncharacterized protein n=1 Tax=Negadavirga shengliensis TaxID=1389218 RepID=A0ABV9T0Z8_9BACT
MARLSDISNDWMRSLWGLFLFMISTYPASSEVTLPKLFGDRMVLQRERQHL